MPRRYGGSPQPRGYGGYARESGDLYQAEATPPAWFTGLTEAVGGYMEVNGARKAREQEQQDKFNTMNNNIKGQMMLANAGIESAFQKQEADQRESRLAAEKQTVIADLAERFTGGDLSAGAKLAAMGMPAATINSLKPEQKKPDPENPSDRSYMTTIGRLKAEKEMGVGNFKPKPATPPTPAVSMMEVRRRASEGVRTMAGAVLDMNPNASQSAVINAVINDPSNKDLAQNEAFQRTLRSVVAREMDEERRRRVKPGSGAKPSLGSRASAMKK